jgi:DNA-binding winged helix-turn-helix (wHTH) protein/Tol biopolymer transport system component
MSMDQKELREFGPFQLDEKERLLRRQGVPVRLTPKAFDVLTILVAHAGTLVTRESLLKAVWPDTFVEEANLSYTMSLLRKALGDTHTPYRYVQTVVGHGYRFVGAVTIVEVVDAVITVDPDPEVAVSEPLRSGVRRSLLIFGGTTAIVVAMVFALTWRGRIPVASEPSRVVHPQFALAGRGNLRDSPTWSPDGRRLAYASDQGGNFDIWIQPMSGDLPRRLTRGTTANWQPDWCPGPTNAIVFRSEREGGGLFTVPAGGGTPRRLTTFGYAPKCSPDGTRVFFYETQFRAPSTVPRLFVIDIQGGAPKEVLATVPRPLGTCCWRGAAWYPDGRHISALWGMAARPSDPAPRPDRWQFWTFAIADGRSLRSDIAPWNQRRMDLAFTGRGGTFTWSASRDAVLVLGADQASREIWRVPVDAVTLEWSTLITRQQTVPAAASAFAFSPAGDRLAVASSRSSSKLWAFPIEPAADRVYAEGEAIEQPAIGVVLETPDLSSDGRQMAYADFASGALHVRNMADTAERPFFGHDEFRRAFPRWSRDSRSLLYVRTARTQAIDRALVRMTVGEGREQVLTTPGAFLWLNSDATSDGRSIVATVLADDHKRTEVVAVSATAGPHAEQYLRLIAADPAAHVWLQQVSPGDPWIALTIQTPLGSTAYVRRLSGGPLTRVADGVPQEWQDGVRWRPDGRALYFVSDRGGFFDVWARDFDPATGPTGQPRKLTAFDSPARFIWPMPAEGSVPLQLAAARDRLLLSLAERSGNILVLDSRAAVPPPLDH